MRAKPIGAIVACVLMCSTPEAQADDYVPRHEGCNTRACDLRVKHRHWRQTIQPYRAWLRVLRWCESRNSNIVNSIGAAGYYQFLPQTWVHVGGELPVVKASKLEQGYRAVKLRRELGTGPWVSSRSCTGT